MGALLVALSAAGLTVVPAGPATAATAYTFYASPEVSDGSGRACDSAANACSLNDARNKVRTVNSNMTGDIVVKLLGGTYSLSSAFTLTQSSTTSDSGTNGYNVIYENYNNDIPVLSGGKKITGWTQYDSTKGIWSAPAPANADSRQLYVNGVRQTRARGDEVGTWTETTTGWTTTDSTFQNYKNLTGVELVSNVAWMQIRCPVASATATTVTMAQPCWKNANINTYTNFYGITRVENAYELLDTAGEWYLDRTGAVAGNTSPRVYFKPANASTLTTDQVVLPTLETLVSATGTSSNKLRNVQFKNIRFENATWLRPNGTEGYPVCQSGYLYYGTNGGKDSEDLFRTPGNVDVQQATNIRFEGNTFARLGAAGLSVMKGTQDITIVGNRFEDISSSAVNIGHINDHHPATADIVKNISFTNNYVVRAGAEYQDAAAVLAAYPQYLTVSRNEVSNLPYTGISVGWGWGRNDVGGQNGYTTATPLKNNTITYNYVHDYMKALGDGGGIYTQSDQPDSVVKYNYLRKTGGGHGLYADEGTQHMAWENNVIGELGYTANYWLSMGPKSKNNTAANNYSDTNSVNFSTNNTSTNNQTGLTSWPAEAQTIISNAGIQNAWSKVKQTNLALTGTATATSSASVNHAASFAIDGRVRDDSGYAKRWVAAGSALPQTLTVDLGASYKLSSIKHKSAETDNSTFKYKVEGSTNNSAWSTLVDHTGTAVSDGRTDTVTGTYRYVRMTMTWAANSHWATSNEFEIYGTNSSDPS